MVRLTTISLLLVSLASIHADTFFAYWSTFPPVAPSHPLTELWKEPPPAHREDPAIARDAVYEAVTVVRYRRVCRGGYCTTEPYTTTEWRRVE